MIKLKDAFVSNFLVLLSGNSISHILPILFAPILARLFSPEDFALHGNFTAVVSMIAIIAAGRYDLAIQLPSNNQKVHLLFNLAIRLIIFVSILSFSIYFFKPLLFKIYKNPTLNNYLFIIPFSVLFAALNSLFIQWSTRMKIFKKLAINKIVHSLALNISSLILGYIGYTQSGLIYGWLIGLIIANIFLYLIIRKEPPKLIQYSYERLKNIAVEYKEFPLINSLHAFSDIFFNQFLLYLMITKTFGLVELGLFILMSRYLRAPVRLLSGSIGQLYYREASELFHSNQVHKAFYKTLKILLPFAVIFTIILSLFAPDIFKWYLGEKWTQSGIYAQIMIIPIALNLLTSPLSSTPLIYKKQFTSLLFSFAGNIAPIIMLIIGHYLELTFITTLKLFAIATSTYYIALLIWYFSLSKNK